MKPSSPLRSLFLFSRPPALFFSDLPLKSVTDGVGGCWQDRRRCRWWKFVANRVAIWSMLVGGSPAANGSSNIVQ